MPEFDLTPIKDRLAKAHTEWGEWTVQSDEWGECHSVIIQDDGPGYSLIAGGISQGEDDGLADATFIAEAPTDIAALVAEVERLRERQGSHDLANEAIRWKRAALDAKEAHDALHAQLDAVRELHRPHVCPTEFPAIRHCNECMDAHPCPTIRALGGEQ